MEWCNGLRNSPPWSEFEDYLFCVRVRVRGRRQEFRGPSASAAMADLQIIKR